MKPVKFPEHTTVLAENQDEYQNLPVFVNDDEFISCWHLSWRERFQLLIGGRLWSRQFHCGKSLQPQLPQVEPPFLKNYTTHT